jgi:hypothetical protein
MGVSKKEAARLCDTYAEIAAKVRNFSFEGTRW